MKCSSLNDVIIQREYYARTAHQYNEMHIEEDDAHRFALHIMYGSSAYLGIQSILDVGSGTGRVLVHAKQNNYSLLVKGVEPVKELREIGYAQGVSRSDLIDGDALALPFDDGAFDLVCAFAALHHIRNPELAIREMCRVARKAIFISDANNFGQGSFVSRLVKQMINMCGMWPIADYFKTRGRGYTITAGDGLAYSYSVFNNYEQIKKCCERVHLINTSAGGVNPYRTAESVALLGIKK